MLQNIKTFLYLGQKGRGRLVRLCVQWSHPIVPTMGGWGGGRGQMCINVLYTSYMITVEKVTDASYESDAAATASIKV